MGSLGNNGSILMVEVNTCANVVILFITETTVTTFVVPDRSVTGTSNTILKKQYNRLLHRRSRIFYGTQ